MEYLLQARSFIYLTGFLSQFFICNSKKENENIETFLLPSGGALRTLPFQPIPVLFLYTPVITQYLTTGVLTLQEASSVRLVQ